MQGWRGVFRMRSSRSSVSLEVVKILTSSNKSLYEWWGRRTYMPIKWTTTTTLYLRVIIAEGNNITIHDQWWFTFPFNWALNWKKELPQRYESWILKSKLLGCFGFWLNTLKFELPAVLWRNFEVIRERRQVSLIFWDSYSRDVRSFRRARNLGRTLCRTARRLIDSVIREDQLALRHISRRQHVWILRRSSSHVASPTWVTGV